MKGTIMQLSSLGVETNIIIDKNGTTPFRTVFHRYTPFYLELKQYLFANKQVTLKNDGDLITRIYLQCDLPAVNQVIHSIDWPKVYYDYLIPGEAPFIDQPSDWVWQTRIFSSSSSFHRSTLARIETAILSQSPLAGDILAAMRGQNEYFQTEIAQISFERKPDDFQYSLHEVVTFMQRVIEEPIIDEITGRIIPWVLDGVAAGLLGQRHEIRRAFRKFTDTIPMNLPIHDQADNVEERYHSFLVRSGVNPVRTSHIAASTRRAILDSIVNNTGIAEEIQASTHQLRETIMKHLLDQEDIDPIIRLGIRMKELKESSTFQPEDVEQVAEEIRSISAFSGIEIPILDPQLAAPPTPSYSATLTPMEKNYLDSYLAVQSMLNDVFLEQAYYQYLHDTVGYIMGIKYSNSTNFLNYKLWLNRLDALLPSSAGAYDHIVINSYFFFNRAEILRKLPILNPAKLDSFDKAYTWRFRMLFLGVMDFNTYREFVRTNKNFMVYLYGIKKTGNITWLWNKPGYVSPYPPLNPVEVNAYTSRIRTILARFTNDAEYQQYYQQLITSTNNQLDEDYPSIDTTPRLTLIDAMRNALTLQEGFYYQIQQPPITLSAHARCKVTLYSLRNCRGWMEGPITLNAGDTYVPKRPVRSLSVVGSGRTGGLYKGLPIIQNDPFIISNDLTMKIILGPGGAKSVKITRVNVPQIDLFFRFEKQRWMITNDFFTIAYNSDKQTSYPVSGFQTSPNLFLSVYPDTDPWGFVPRPGHRLIEKADFIIGDQVVQSIDSYWFDLFEDMFMSDSKIPGYKKMIGDTPELTAINNSDTPPMRLIIPLPFWFTDSNESAFPMIALVNTECKIQFVMKSLESLILGWSPSLVFSSATIKTTLLVEYANLDIEERTQFSTRKHQYIIRQTTKNSYHPFSQDGLIRFSLKNPVTDLFCMFVLPTKDAYSPATGVITSIKIIVNGAEMSLTSLKPEVYELGYPLERYARNKPGIYAFPFALYPRQSQPSGSLNFSYVPSATFRITRSPTFTNVEDYQAIILARSYNVLYIMSGQASLLY